MDKNTGTRGAVAPATTASPAPSPAAPAGEIVAPNGATTAAKTDDAVEAKRGTYTVAPGRTVDGKAPGETVKLDEQDAQRMLELGFILDKDGSIVIRADGPAVSVEDGVQVKTAA